MNYFDCHADTLVNMPENQGTLGENQCNIDLKRARGFAEKYTQIFAIWNDFKVIEALVKPEHEIIGFQF